MKLADILNEARGEKKNGLVVDADGTKRWYKNGKLHRADGPAIEYTDGAKHWYINGKWHRTDGPAIEWGDRTKRWYVNGKLHRTDGPAEEWGDGRKRWWVNGNQHTSNKSFQQAAKLSDKEMIALVLKYGDVS